MARRMQPLFQSELDQVDMAAVDWDLNREKLALLFGVSSKTIDAWSAKGLPRVKAGKVVRFNQRVTFLWLKEMGKQTNTSLIRLNKTET